MMKQVVVAGWHILVVEAAFHPWPQKMCTRGWSSQLGPSLGRPQTPDQCRRKLACPPAIKSTSSEAGYLRANSGFLPTSVERNLRLTRQFQTLHQLPNTKIHKISEWTWYNVLAWFLTLLVSLYVFLILPLSDLICYLTKMTTYYGTLTVFSSSFENCKSYY